jgi:hypothetical protein
VLCAGNADTDKYADEHADPHTHADTDEHADTHADKYTICDGGCLRAALLSFIAVVVSQSLFPGKCVAASCASVCVDTERKSYDISGDDVSSV